MQLITENNISIDTSRLCEITEYARFKDIVYTTVGNRIYKGTIKSVKISNTVFVIVPKEDVEDYLAYRAKIEEEGKVDLSDY